MERGIGLISLGMLVVFAMVGVVAFIMLRRRRLHFLLALTASVLLVLVLFIATALTFRMMEASNSFKIIAWLLMALTGCLLIACVLWLIAKFFEWLGAADPAGGTVNPEERQRIIGMVEQNKMTAQEGTELLDALGKSSALRGQQTFSRLDIMILVGIAATVLGFFLPWQWFPNILNMLGQPAHQTGYQVQVVGWAMLTCSVLAVAFVFITPKGYLYKLLMFQILCICVGLALVLSVWIQAGYNVGYGAIICVAGFAVALLACVMKMRALAR
jgi:hypothetical protein